MIWPPTRRIPKLSAITPQIYSIQAQFYCKPRKDDNDDKEFTRGCGFCQGGTLSNPNELIALSSPHQVHSCLEWQERNSLTENFNDETCDFLGPFYEAICGCSNMPPNFYQCDLCGSPDMVFNNPSKGLLIPKSNSAQIMCGAVHTGVYRGAVSPNDCQLLKGIVDYCGGCIPATEGAEEVTERSPTLSPTIESFVSIVGTGEPSSAPTATPSIFPTATHSDEPSVSPTEEPTIAPTEKFVSRHINREILIEFVNLSERSRTCDLCPPTGTLSAPDKVVTMVNINNQIVTQTCGALLWDTRAGRNDIDDAGCSFLQSFFGAICGCSTFTPFSDETGQTVIGTTASTGHCKLCENPTHVFQRPNDSLRIPGSNTTQITCGGIFAGAKNGAVSANECEILSSLADACGGCGDIQSGLLQSRFYQGSQSQKQSNRIPHQRHLYYSSIDVYSRLSASNAMLRFYLTQECIDCLDDNDSSIYIYKDFGESGTTFHKALSAPRHCDPRSRRHERQYALGYIGRQQSERNDDCPRLLYPELEGCVLAPISSFDELLRIQSVIPPEKAAYTAVHKDKLQLKKEAEECYSTTKSNAHEDVSFEVSGSGVSRRISSENCRVENWMEGLKFGYNHDEDEYVAKSTNTANEILDTCQSLKVGWTNYNTGTDVPQNLWNNGQLSYCNRGPSQEAGAVWAVEPTGQNYGDLRDVSTNWMLPGAVPTRFSDLMHYVPLQNNVSASIITL
eukprot:jgi/Psemu1/8461/gm1.8461_g